MTSAGPEQPDEPVTGTDASAEDALRRQQEQDIALHSATSALERVRAEALQYRKERDELRRQLVEARRDAAERTSTSKALRRDLTRLQRRLESLQSGRAHRSAAVVRRVRRSLRRRMTVSVKPRGRLSVTAGKATPALPATLVEPPPVVRFADDLRRDEPALLAERAGVAAASAERLAAAAAEGRPLRVAAIVDEFTRRCLRLECDLVDLHPDTWQEELEAADVDLLFVESAWRGHEGTWHNAVHRRPPELLALLEHCRERGVPTAFWNKEDPVHFHTFLEAASEFDHVFTTDADRVPRYRDALGHERVHLLPFAAQPRLHHPVEGDLARKDAMVFAGGYYTRYPERMRDLDALLEGASSVVPVEIFDRMLGTTHDAYRFPERYEQHVVGSLDPSRIDYAYKGYRFALNLNSVKQSQSMFARRAYELLASGTVTLSNYARGLRVMLGDLVPMTDGSARAAEIVAGLRDDALRYDRLRLMGLRKVHAEHTYRERLRYVVAAVTGAPYEVEVPAVLAVARVATAEQLEHLDVTVRAQSGVRARLVVVADDAALADEARRRGLEVVAAAGSLGPLAADDAGVAVLDARDWYGPTYLQDLVLASRYAGTDVVGHAGFSALVDGRLEEQAVHRAYHRCTGLAARRSLVLPELAARTGLGALLDDPAVLDDATQLTIDRFDYVQDGAGAAPDVLEPLRGVLDLDTGRPVADVLGEIDRTPAVAPDRPVLSHQVLLDLRGRDRIATRLVRGGVRVTSRLGEEQRSNFWLGRPFPIEALWPDRDVRYSIESEGQVEVAPFIRFFDEHGTALASVTRHANVAVHLTPPEGAVSCRLGVRFIGRGEATVSAFNVGPQWGLPTARPGTGRVLVLTNAYPAYDDLYRNGFVHARVRTYLQDGLSLDVFRYVTTQPQSYAEFEGVEVTTGNDADLHRVLEEGDYDTVLVHFLLEPMWQTLRAHADRLRVVVWLHGAEVQPWWRREFNYQTPEELEAAKPASDARLAFWRGVVDDLPDRTSFVFVSQYFADEVMTDLERTFPADRVSIVHNPVDTDIFRYVPKPVEQRTRILSIRPYATRKYANDLSVAAVLELSKEPWFDDLEFLFVGDGTLFDEVLEPIRDLPNVTVQQGFLTQPEIAELHREYGVFLVPTRMDAQGVSKDEAMASGLVPVTNDVAAIPEFVSEAEGYLAAPDDATGMADAIRDLYLHPEVFAAKSAAAAARVRVQTAADVVVPAEVALIRGERPAPEPDEPGA